MQEKQVAQLAHDSAMHRKVSEVTELQQHLSRLVSDLDQRQAEVESAAPVARLQADEFALQLTQLRISDAFYADLRALPRSSLAPLDAVKLAVHEAEVDLRADNERLRQTLAASRETAARAEEEAARARVQAGRMAATLSERERDLQGLADGMGARVERLAEELQAATLRAEVSAAKGQMYDDLKAQCESLQEDVGRLSVVEATFKRMEDQLAESGAAVARREHTLEMLMMDKAYLTQQVDFLAAAQRKLEGDAEVRERKVTDLQRNKIELLDRLMAAEVLQGRNEGSRLHKELGALQASTHADIERIRVETAEAYEREARLLRELRDHALEEASRAKSSLAQLQSLHEHSLVERGNLQRQLEAQVSELQSELKQRSFELSHFKVVIGEKETMLGRANMQLELLGDKLSVALDRVRCMDAEQSTAMARAALSAATSTATALGGPGMRGPPGLSDQQGALPLLHCKWSCWCYSRSVLFPSCLPQLFQEQGQLLGKISVLEERLRSAKEMLQLASQPHAFLIAELGTGRELLRAAEAQALTLTGTLQAREHECSQLGVEVGSLRQDLEMVLGQREQLQGLKQVVMRALGTTGMVVGAAGEQQQQQLQSGRRQMLQPGQTLIIGAGSH
ncbi:MAG: hypothetical protein WDW38_002253 [Sanguina aurantia]